MESKALEKGTKLFIINISKLIIKSFIIKLIVN
jgi:hypothetical protein